MKAIASSFGEIRKLREVEEQLAKESAHIIRPLLAKESRLGKISDKDCSIIYSLAQISKGKQNYTKG